MNCHRACPELGPRGEITFMSGGYRDGRDDKSGAREIYKFKIMLNFKEIVCVWF